LFLVYAKQKMNNKISFKLSSDSGCRSTPIPQRHFFAKQFSDAALPKSAAVGGFTLVEVVVSFFLFTLLAAGLFSSALQVRKWAEASVRESVSTAVATGFLEQLAATDFHNIINRIEDRSVPFSFVTQDGQALEPEKSLRPMDATDWGDPIEVPLVNKLDEDGNEIDGPAMDFWFIPSVERSADTPNEAVDIRIFFRWDNGQGRDEASLPVRSLFLVRTRVPN